MTELFIAGTGPEEVDVVYQTVRVGGNGTCLAASYTPAAEVREVQYPLYPPEFREWAARNAPQPPTEVCPPPQAPAEIVARLAPIGAGSVVTGTQVFISGTARGPFILEVGPGGAPTTWQTIAQNPMPVEDGLLGVWITGGLAPGDYTLRLRVITVEGLSVTAEQVVRYAPGR